MRNLGLTQGKDEALTKRTNRDKFKEFYMCTASAFLLAKQITRTQ